MHISLHCKCSIWFKFSTAMVGIKKQIRDGGLYVRGNTQSSLLTEILLDYPFPVGSRLVQSILQAESASIRRVYNTVQ